MTEEQRNKRLEYHLYESNEGIEEHAERIVALEELALDLYHDLAREDRTYRLTDLSSRLLSFGARMEQLGIEVDA